MGFQETERRVTMRLEGDVLFDFEKSQLRAGGETALQKLAAILVRFPSAAVLIEGHSDSTGKPSVNLDLSETRATSVQDFLRNRPELSSITFIARGHGQSKPVASNDTDEGRHENRRVEIIVEKASIDGSGDWRRPGVR